MTHSLGFRSIPYGAAPDPEIRVAHFVAVQPTQEIRYYRMRRGQLYAEDEYYQRPATPSNFTSFELNSSPEMEQTKLERAHSHDMPVRRSSSMQALTRYSSLSDFDKPSSTHHIRAPIDTLESARDTWAETSRESQRDAMVITRKDSDREHKPETLDAQRSGRGDTSSRGGESARSKTSSRGGESARSK
eukprot:CAMPEP_0174312786 /NCGR_PEP_ID=MMETSP0810-20121108/4519_1 /TAXON_ID=73025 ORGANISM="Eutreptiella gymnastica-like, Strain CCMP1594" /NCGR_SAMPLE_ID=MMETSP0810 /ASSEMBLY_ACC=CAM_ASM_000659 /LENGTH=188 /DNA_ID=CAMNT_0015421289 /DNA_START=54 /DNA_END=617 /DNA_ORIENTATION=-